MAAQQLPLIDVSRLRLGMYVVLDVGWTQHPFPLNNFTLKSAEQLKQLRAMGRRKVRYSPERSSAEPLTDAELEAELQAETARVAAARAASEPAVADAVAEQKAPVALVSSEPALEAKVVALSPLQRQEEALKVAEAEYRQAVQGHQTMLKHLQVDPQLARRAAETLGETLLKSVADERELTVRLLASRVGDQPSGHEIGVTALSLLLARESGFSALAMQELALAALLHDIGKTKIPGFLHEDHGRLTDFERRTFRRHVELGVELAEAMGLPWSVRRAMAEHHERFDGGGFPAGLRGAEMSAAGRILAIVNRYHNLVCPLRLESGLTPHLAVQKMYSVERSHFDAELLARFVGIMGVYPPGTLVELTDKRMALVIAARPGLTLSPRVQIVEKPDEDEPSLAIDLDPASGVGVHRSLRPDDLNARWAQRARQMARTALYLEPVVANDEMARLSA